MMIFSLFSPDFPPLSTVRAAFTAHGALSKIRDYFRLEAVPPQACALASSVPCLHSRRDKERLCFPVHRASQRRFFRSRFSTFRQSYHGMLVGVPSEPASSFRRAACNNAWNFITTHFTFPQTRHVSHGFCLSANAMFRLVPSGDSSARAFLRILTVSIRRPAYGQRRPLRAGFGGIPLRLPSADFTELLTVRRLRAGSPIGGSAWTFPGVAPSFRPSDCQFCHEAGLRRHDAQSFQL